MDDRQRFIAALTFGRPDRIPLDPGGPRESTMRAWTAQGLPEGADWYAHLMRTLGIAYLPSAAPRLDLGVDFKMIPTFEEKVLEHRDGHYIVQDWMGAITEISDTYDYTYIRSAKDFVTRKWHRFPVQDAARLGREDLLALRPRSMSASRRILTAAAAAPASATTPCGSASTAPSGNCASGAASKGCAC
jgi:hypothetical protein